MFRQCAIAARGRMGRGYEIQVLGRFIGVSIDAGSGAMHEYPSSITVYPPSETFPSEEDRDAYFDKRIVTVSADAEAAKKKIVTYRADDSGDNAGCKRRQDEIDTERDRLIQNLESQRAAATISS